VRNAPTRPGTPGEFLLSLPRFAIVGSEAYKPGLERMRELMKRLGDPHTAFRSVHVAGTNGKGSTASFIAAMGTAAGKLTGLHTSPHLLHVAERMRIDGVPAPMEWVDAAVDRHADLMSGIGVSYFEATTALSFLYFAEKHVDFAAVEVGLGGRFDATNVLMPELSVITSVALDHEDILGDTVDKIAREKAGIIKRGIPALTAAWDPSVLTALAEAAEQAGAPLHVLDREVKIRVGNGENLSIETPERVYAPLKIGVPGRRQQRNAALAVRASELCQTIRSIRSEHITAALKDVRRLAGLRGRCERIARGPDVYVDVAHNPEAMIASVQTCLDEAGRIDHLFIGQMKDKQIQAFATWFSGQRIPVTTLRIESDRARTPVDLAGLLQQEGIDVTNEGGLSVHEALERFRLTPSDRVALFLGSHIVVADALAWSESLE